ncbi:trefoil factor 2 S homeolog [Chelydra serpentina]|uniref:Trefoil factor 2 S-like protein n=1 Tax=Chelydra serpentina TaxID=8475 RepID=A0A8T1S6C4_CHESE|nr:trefoil factor 2 S homeolog [Chelydra serpentina]
MEQKGIQLLSVILILGLSALTEGAEAPAPCRCNVDPKSRNNCGPPGVTAEQCENAGCCFSSEVPGVPWCFSPLAKKYKKVCPAEVKLRRNCGYPGIPANVCEARGCCFESKPPAVPWCFFPLLVEEGLHMTMEHKGCWLLAIVLILGLSSLANGYIQLSQEQCAQQPSARVNCGFPYISAEACNNRGCCFDNSIAGVIWCFFPRAEEECVI